MARQRGGGAAQQQQQQKQQQGEKKQQPSRRSNPLLLSAAPSKTLLPGRHPCSCQARLHELVRNCMGCGKVVCAQESSGPCFFCSTLVCTNQEKEILDRGSRKSAELYKQLTGKDMPNFTFLLLLQYQGDSSASTIEQEWADVECLGRQSEEAAALETERRGYAICLPQPEASLVANGFIKAIRWPEDPMLVGPLFICSAVTEGAADGEKAAVSAAIKKYKLPESASLLDFSSGSVHGRSFLADTLTIEEYKQESGNVDSLPVVGSERDRGFVLVFSASEPLLMSIPHIPPVAPGTVYQLDGALKMALSHVFAAA